MSIIIASNSNAWGNYEFTLTCDSGIGGFEKGYIDSEAFGSISPTVLKGVTIVQCSTLDSPNYFFFSLSVQVPQSFFNLIDMSGEGFGTYASADADSFTSGGGGSFWRWDTVGFEFPTSGTVTVFIEG